VAVGDDVVRLVDLSRLHAPIRGDIDAAIAHVVDGGRFVLGEQVEAFEREMATELGVGHVVAVSSGSDALLSLLWAAGIGAGDEVIVPTFTFVAPAEAIVHAGATPVFVDVTGDLVIDVDAVAARITERTRAILAVDLFGLRASFERLNQDGIALIEDAAQASTSTGIAKGVRGAAMSFFPTKNLGAFGDGGMVVTGDGALAAEVRRLRVHGSRQKYVHERIGWNMRLDALQAAVLRVKLPHVRAWNASRRRIAAMYREGLAGLDGCTLPAPSDTHAWHQYVVQAPARDALRAALAAREIETEVHYPLALHLQPAFEHVGGRIGEHPHAERATREVLSLPIHPMLRDDEIARVIDGVRSFFR
jgi:dTDP-4-amino-4,6-dideoxygalactose transaminase